MAQPVPYVRQKIWGTDPVVGEDVDNEFDAVEATLSDVLDNIEVLQRDDTALQNGIVTPDSLSAQTLALIGGGWNPRGDWAYPIAYAVSDLVVYAPTGVSYLCVTAHTSTGSFANDLAADYWLILRAAQVQTTDIDDDAVTYAKIQDIAATDRLLGRDTAGAGIVEELTVGGGLEFSGAGGIQRSALTGAITASAASGVTALSNDVVTTAKILALNVTAAKLAADAVETAKIKDLNVTAAKLAADAVTTAKILDGQVTKAKIESVTAGKLLGRSGAGAGAPQEITLGSRLSMPATTLNVEDPGWTVITASDPSAVATLNFTASIGSTYDCYAIVGRLIPATDNRSLYLRVSTDGGSTFKSGASDYGWVVIGGYASADDVATAEDSGDTAADIIRLTGGGAAGVGNATTEGCEFTIYFHAPSSTAVHKRFNGVVSGLDASGNPLIATFAGVYKATTAINGVRLYFSTGNIASGHVVLYGLKKA